jgi:hypothetical protein
MFLELIHDQYIFFVTDQMFFEVILDQYLFFVTDQMFLELIHDQYIFFVTDQMFFEVILDQYFFLSIQFIHISADAVKQRALAPIYNFIFFYKKVFMLSIFNG